MPIPAFKRIRIQTLFPCAAHCAWCRTHLKNPLFSRMHRSGRSAEVHDFYVKVVEKYQPEELYVSGGESTLLPGIGQLLLRLQPHVQRIFLYCSYQFPAHVLASDPFAGVDTEKLILTHTCIHFEPEKWETLTGFPYQLYVDNLLRARDLPYRKRVKFILNHDDREEEVREFLRVIQPDARFELRYKLLNEQNNGFGKEGIERSRESVRKLLEAGRLDLKVSDPRIAKGVAREDIVAYCPFRFNPVELRFAFWRERPDGVCLKVRYCPYFGPDTFEKFVVGEHSLHKLDKWFREGSYRQRCGSCRLLLYHSPSNIAVGRPSPNSSTRAE